MKSLVPLEAENLREPSTKQYRTSKSYESFILCTCKLSKKTYVPEKCKMLKRASSESDLRVVKPIKNFGHNQLSKLKLKAQMVMLYNSS